GSSGAEAAVNFFRWSAGTPGFAGGVKGSAARSAIQGPTRSGACVGSSADLRISLVSLIVGRWLTIALRDLLMPLFMPYPPGFSMIFIKFVCQMNTNGHCMHPLPSDSPPGIMQFLNQPSHPETL